MATFLIFNKIQLSNPYSNIDYYYGPYNSVADACEEIPVEMRQLGLTVGIMNSDTRTIEEYWWNKGTSNNDLIKKIDFSDDRAYVEVGETAPDNKKHIWISDFDLTTYTEESEIVKGLYAAYNNCLSQINELKNLLRYGIVSGDAQNGARLSTVTTGDIAINPITGEEEETEVVLPGTIPPTVPNISIKLDTSENFVKYVLNLISGELVFTTDTKLLYMFYEGLFYKLTGAGGSGGLSAEEIMAFYFVYLGFTSQGSERYRLIVDNKGKAVFYKNEETELKKIDIATGNVWVSGRFNINSVFCGGDYDEHSRQSCSHNFVELGNCDTKDINLLNIYLLYAPDSDTPWEVLPLRGVIKSGRTFLIRGALCSIINANTTKIHVDTYDQEWYDSNGKLIKFSLKSPIFYLAYGVDGKFYNQQGELVSPSQLTRVPYQTEILKGYIDSVGFGTGSGEGGNPAKLTSGESWSNAVWVRYFTMDPVSQANKAYESHKSSSLWTYVNMEKKENLNLNNPLLYYSELMKLSYKPLGFESSKSIFTTKSTFSEHTPNMLNITFGIQATETVRQQGAQTVGNEDASRCFNWISVGYYDEYLELTKDVQNNAPNWNNSLKYDSIQAVTQQQIDAIINSEKTVEDKENELTQLLNTFGVDYKTTLDLPQNGARLIELSKIYYRLRWETPNAVDVTTHKVIVRGLSSGTYYYRVKRYNDDSYVSDVLSFTVKKDSEVTEFKFVQVSDQQGFNWLEYQAWKKSCLAINQHVPDALFTINTGDITQNGNRENEWLDYYDGRQYLRDKEEMFTIGNNDLCGINEYELGDGTAGKYKISHNNVLHYYTFQLQEENLPIFKSLNPETSDYTEYYMPSLYSYNFGAYHFVSINSEFADNTYKVYRETKGNFIEDTYRQIADWFKRDLQIWQGIDESEKPNNCSKVICFMHEMPFTIITYDTATGSSGRGGSKLNTMKTKDYTYYWSRIFKQYGIRLCLGGHKHTYSMTYPVYDAPEGYINETTHTVNSGVDFWGNIDSTTSLRPIIQVTDVSQIKKLGHPNMARYEVVDKIDAPVYCMCQATGYKLVSNKEVPSRDTDSNYKIHWLYKYFPGIAQTGKTDNANENQYYPTYIIYTLKDAEIYVDARQIHGIYTEPNHTTRKGGSFNINNQLLTEFSSSEIIENGYTIIL